MNYCETIKRFFTIREKRNAILLSGKASASPKPFRLYIILNKENVDREVSGLLEAMEKFDLEKGLLLIYDTEVKASDIPETIEIMPVWKWLLATTA